MRGGVAPGACTMVLPHVVGPFGEDVRLGEPDTGLAACDVGIG